jgi:hypothetical protein
MTTIWMDPSEMTAEAGLLQDVARRTEAAATSVRSLGCCGAPASIAGWIAEELEGSAVQTLVSTVGFLLESIDLVLRADGLAADQSLATAAPALATVDTPLVGGFVLGAVGPTPEVPSTGWGQGFVLGQVGPAATYPSTGWGGPGLVLGQTGSSSGVSMPGLSSAAFAAQNAPWSSGGGFVLNPYSGPGWRPLPLGPGLGGSSLPDSAGYVTIKNLTAPDGIDYVNATTIEDESGRRGSTSQMVRNRETGRMEVL